MSLGLPKSERGHVFDIPIFIERLMSATDENAFLIITIAHSDDFLQLSGDMSGVQLNFPLINARQRSFEGRFREIAKHESLGVEENYGSNGARFLDIHVNGESQYVSSVCSRLLREVFSVSGNVELIFQYIGLAPDRAA